MLAYYGYNQNSYATGKDAGCSTTVSGGCTARRTPPRSLLDYRLTKRFDVYIGTFWSEVQDGLAAGYQLTDPGEGCLHHEQRLDRHHHHGYSLQVLKPARLTPAPSAGIARARTCGPDVFSPQPKRPVM